ncbi:MAG: hypothetical protein JF628_08360 [Sphingomonas sp.]|nr:hypothetical protein [Sphingomonas sp.]
MIWDSANIIGLIGDAAMVIAFVYSNVSKSMNLVVFNLLNLVGAAMLGASLTVHFNMASMALEIVWAAIALFGLVKALSTRARA